MQMSDHAKGLIVTMLGVTILSADAVLIRLIGTDHWTVIFWRGLMLGSIFLAATLWRHGRNSGRAIRAVGWLGVLAGALLGVGTSFFVVSISLTSAANTLVIIAAIPLFAAIFGRLFLGEAVARRTWWAIAAAIAGIAILVSGSLQYGGILGDLAAIATAILLGAYFTVMRKAGRVSMLPALSLGGFIGCAMGAIFAGSLMVPAEGLPYLLLLGLVVIPLATGLIATGPRYLPAAEASLLMLLETVLGPIWVWLVLAELPSQQAFLGGAIVLGALAIHSMIGLRATRRAQARAALPA